MSNYLKIETDTRGVCTFWLNRPEKRNALDEIFLSAILKAATDVATDDKIRVVVLRSTSVVFCAGADLNDWADVSPSKAQRLSRLGSRAFQTLADLEVPVIAAIAGAALGGGLELAMACDIRIGTDDCHLGYPEPRLGNSPAWGGMSRLIDAIGKAHARSMLLTGDAVSGQEAFRIGLLQRLCSQLELQKLLEDVIASVLACDSETLSYMKCLLGQPSQLISAQEAAVAGYTATRLESRDRKAAFLATRTKKAEVKAS